ncbi:hypothetical protein ACFS5N_06690 [Mucilaginibacter ximonensis]|uniref:Uncharacterized protein n=1 Tax=Mucilaginibacter ximonensis TaxID=538021 RepID=A0ABW5YBH7_9SPHI
MKNFITSVFIILSSTAFVKAQQGLNFPIYTSKTVVSQVSGITSSKYSGAMGQAGVSYRDGAVTRISYCLNSGNEAAKKENNKWDTTTYRVSIARNGSTTVITHPDGTISNIYDSGDAISINAAGGVSKFIYKLSAPSQSADDNPMYMADYNKNVSEIRTVYGTAFKFERKANIATIMRGDGSYQVMITTGKTSVVIDSKGAEALVVNDSDGDSAVMNADGSNYIVVNAGGKSQIIHNDNKIDNINSFGGLGILVGGDGKFTTMFNYNKTGTNKDAYGADLSAFNSTDGGELTRTSFYKNTIATVSN